MQLCICRGIPGSGKTTWAKEQIKNNPGKYKRVNKDELRAMLDASVWTKSNEIFIEEVRDDIILKSLARGIDVIVDDTNISAKHINKIQIVADKYEETTGKTVNVYVTDFYTDVNLCIERDAQREFPVGKDVILQMLASWEKNIGKYEGSTDIEKQPKYLWLKKFNLQAPPAYIFDMDGTLSLLNGRDPYNAETCEDDIINVPVFDVYYKLFNTNTIFIFSGRENKYRDQTEKFLIKHGIHQYTLIMRETGDMRGDEIIKLEMYEEHIKGKFDVLGVFDDRPKVRRMWIKQGLFVFSCYQDLNFKEF